MLKQDAFEEITVLGKNFCINYYEAKILPDRYFVADIIALADGRWEEIEEAEYEDFKKACFRDYKLVEF